VILICNLDLSDLVTRHGSVDDKADCQLVMRILLQHEVLNFKKGRSIGGSIHNAVEMKPALDLFHLGEYVITREGFLDDIMIERLAGCRDDEEDSECSEDRGFREEEERYMRNQEGLSDVGEKLWVNQDLFTNTDTNAKEAYGQRGRLFEIRDEGEIDKDEEENNDVNYGDLVYDCTAEDQDRWQDMHEESEFEIDLEAESGDEVDSDGKEYGSDGE